MKYAWIALSIMAVGSIHSTAWALDTQNCNQIAGPSVVLSADQPQKYWYCKGNGSTPQPLPIHLPNASSLDIVVKNINPVTRSFTVTLNGTPYAEIDASAMSILGLPAAPAAASTGTPAATGAKSPLFSASLRLPALSALSLEDQLAQAQSDAGKAHAALTKLETEASNKIAKTSFSFDVHGDIRDRKSGALAKSPPQELVSVSDEIKAAQKEADSADAKVNNLTCRVTYEGAGGVQVKVQNLQTAVESLTKSADSYKSGIAAEQQKYNDALAEISSSTVPNQDEFKKEIASLKAPTTDAPKLSAEDAGADSGLTGFANKPLTDVADSLAAQATALYGSLQGSIGDGCKTALHDETAQDQNNLGSIFITTSSSQSLMDKLKSEITATTSAATTLASQELVLKNVVNNPSNYEMDVTVPPEDRIQTAVAVKITWTDKNLSSSPQAGGSGAQPAGQQAPGSQTAGAQAAPKTTPGAGGGQGSAQSAAGSTPSAPDANTTSFTVSFGQGPRTFESAGIVFSPLAQHSYATAAVDSSPFCTPTGSNTAAGCIVDNSASGWRFLPMALFSVRLADVNWHRYQWRVLIPSYLSVGATIKSSATNGTNLEYLFGPSWVSSGQHIFITGGAYAGTVNQLGGGLVLGLQTIAPPSTLPVSTPYNWGYGFAISYKIGSQGSGGSKASSTPSSGGGGGD